MIKVIKHNPTSPANQFVRPIANKSEAAKEKPSFSKLEWGVDSDIPLFIYESITPPKTTREANQLLIKLGGNYSDICSQLSMYKAGGMPNKDEEWKKVAINKARIYKRQIQLVKLWKSKQRQNEPKISIDNEEEVRELRQRYSEFCGREISEDNAKRINQILNYDIKSAVIAIAALIRDRDDCRKELKTRHIQQEVCYLRHQMSTMSRLIIKMVKDDGFSVPQELEVLLIELLNLDQ